MVNNSAIEEGGEFIIYNKDDPPLGDYAKWNKSDCKRQTRYNPTAM